MRSNNIELLEYIANHWPDGVTISQLLGDIAARAALRRLVRFELTRRDVAMFFRKLDGSLTNVWRVVVIGARCDRIYVVSEFVKPYVVRTPTPAEKRVLAVLSDYGASTAAGLLDMLTADDKRAVFKSRSVSVRSAAQWLRAREDVWFRFTSPGRVGSWARIVSSDSDPKWYGIRIASTDPMSSIIRVLL